MTYIKLVTSLVFKRVINWFIIFFIPILLTIIITFAYRVVDMLDVSTLIPATSTISIILLGILVLPFTILECRKKDILFRLKLAGQSDVSFYAIMALMFAGLMLITYFLNAGISTIIMSNKVNFNMVWKYASYGMVFYSLFWLIACALVTGFLMGMIIQSPSVLLTLSVTFFLLNTILSYLFVSPVLLLAFTSVKVNSDHEHVTLVQVAMYCNIFHYTNGTLFESWFQSPIFETASKSSIFDFNTPFHMPYMYWGSQTALRHYIFTVFSPIDKWLNIFIPVIYTIATFGIIFLYKKLKKAD